MDDKVVFDEKWLDDYCRRTGRPKPNIAGRAKNAEIPQGDPPKRSKYGNRKTERHGRMFDSKHEADVYDELLLLAGAGEICGVACQVAFHLPGGVKYVADFVMMNRDATYTVVDAKSVATRKDKVYRLKRRQMQACLGLVIDER